MSIRYSYSDFTTKGHGVIEGHWGSKHDRVEDSYSISRGMSTEFKLSKIISHVDQISSSIKKMSPNRKAELISTLKSNKGLLIGNTKFVKYISNNKIELYIKPTKKKKKSNGKTDKYSREKSSYKNNYQYLKSINDKANSLRSKGNDIL